MPCHCMGSGRRRRNSITILIGSPSSWPDIQAPVPDDPMGDKAARAHSIDREAQVPRLAIPANQTATADSDVV